MARVHLHAAPFNQQRDLRTGQARLRAFIDDFTYSINCQLLAFSTGSGLFKEPPVDFNERVDRAINKAIGAVKDFRDEVVIAASGDEGSARRPRTTAAKRNRFDDMGLREDSAVSTDENGPLAPSAEAVTRVEVRFESAAAAEVAVGAQTPKSISHNNSVSFDLPDEYHSAADDYPIVGADDSQVSLDQYRIASPWELQARRSTESQEGVLEYGDTVPRYSQSSASSFSSFNGIEALAFPLGNGSLSNHTVITRSNSLTSNESSSSPQGRGSVRSVPSIKSMSLPQASMDDTISYTDDGGGEEDEDLCSQGEDSSRCINGVANPNYWARTLWDLSTMMLVLIDAMVLPFQMAYKGNARADAFDEFWLWTTTSFFSVDIVMNFFTAYVAGPKDTDFEPGRLVTIKSRIARNYIRTWLPIDSVSTVPWGKLSAVLSGDGDSSAGQLGKLTKVVKFVRFMRLMRMLRLAKLAAIWERIEAKCGSIALLQGVGLLRVLFVLVCICHWNACIWWMIGQPSSLFTELLSDGIQEDWKNQVHWTTLTRSFGPGEPQWIWLDRSTSEAYIFCFYWTLGVMRTMPAEVQPVNQPERVYIMFFMFFAFSAFAVCVAQITQTFFKFSERKRLFNDDMSQVRMHLRKLKVSEQLQLKVKTFLRHLYDTRRIQAKELTMLNYLPVPMRQELENARLYFHLDKIETLRYISNKAIALVADCCEMRDLAPGDMLCVKDRVADSVFVLAVGRLNVIRDEEDWSNSLTLGQTHTGSVGSTVKTTLMSVVDEECLTNHEFKSPHTVLAMVASSVLRIDLPCFIELLQSKPGLLKSQRASQKSFGGVERPAPRQSSNSEASRNSYVTREPSMIRMNTTHTTRSRAMSHVETVLPDFTGDFVPARDRTDNHNRRGRDSVVQEDAAGNAAALATG